jgi:hypothetical protein
MSLKLREGEGQIFLLSDDEVKEKCLRFPKGALPNTTVDGYLTLRGTGGETIVRGHRYGAADGETAVRGHSELVKKVNGSAPAEEIEALVKPISWLRYLPRAGWLSWLQVVVALVVAGAAIFGLIETLLDSEASTFLRYGGFGLGVVAATVVFFAAAANALTIKCK